MNWGNKLLVTFIVFGAGISYLVYRSMHTDYELVDKDYYKHELRYQEVIDGSNRANALSGPVTLTRTGAGIRLSLPAEMKGVPLSGTVLFYCAYDAAKDKKFRLDITRDGYQDFQPGAVAPGNYTVKIDWNCDGKNYYTEKSISL